MANFAFVFLAALAGCTVTASPEPPRPPATRADWGTNQGIHHLGAATPPDQLQQRDCAPHDDLDWCEIT